MLPKVKYSGVAAGNVGMVAVQYVQTIMPGFGTLVMNDAGI
jgi:hypothetical protein